MTICSYNSDKKSNCATIPQIYDLHRSVNKGKLEQKYKHSHSFTQQPLNKLLVSIAITNKSYLCDSNKWL